MSRQVPAGWMALDDRMWLHADALVTVREHGVGRLAIEARHLCQPDNAPSIITQTPALEFMRAFAAARVATPRDAADDLVTKAADVLRRVRATLEDGAVKNSEARRVLAELDDVAEALGACRRAITGAVGANIAAK